MARRLRVRSLLLSLVALLAVAGGVAYAQGGATSSLAGTVTDSTGGVVPGADIVVKNNATGTVFTAVSGTNGTFNIPTMPPGIYTATVSLQGFKTVVLQEVTLNVGVPASVKAVLQPGGLQETVVVTGATDVIQTQATSVATTMNARQIANLPAVGRAAFDLVSFTPGVVTGTGSIRDSSVNGLPHAAVNITLDGMNIQDNYAKTWDGMFTRVNPRIDAIEEVTVSSAAQGADMAGQGGVQIRFVTRSGSNTFQGSLYYYLRREWMNSNTWFNTHYNVGTDGKKTDKPPTNYRYPGGRIGGPVMIPGLFDGHDKLFFFVNYELVDNPGTVGNYRTIMSEASQSGVFQYGNGRSVDLWQLAARNGQTTTADPMIARLLTEVRSATAGLPVNPTNDPLTQEVYYQQPTNSRTHYPTVRVDYNVARNHRATFSMTQNLLLSNPDTTNSRQTAFPGFPVHGLQDSKRYTWQGNLRSTLTKNLVNDFRFGGTGGATLFSPDTNAAMFKSGGVGDMGGYAINWSGFKSISNLYSSGNSPYYSAREGSTRVFEDTVSWLKSRHSLGFGFSATRGDVWLKNRQHVPVLNLGIPNGDPADAMFNATNFPGASSSDLDNAKYLYAVLTGRINSIAREARIGTDGSTYNILGESYQQGRMWDMGLFVQDSWRVTPTLTVNGGVRYAVQLPFYALNNSYSTATIDDVFGITGPGAGFVAGSVGGNLGNVFRPGVLEGRPTTYQMLGKQTKGFKTDSNNVAPSVGVAWTTGASGGLLRRIFGAPGDSVLRAGYSMSYQRGGMNDYTEIFGGNPGVLIDATRSLTNGNLGTLPVLLRSSDLGEPSMNLARVYPMKVPSASSNIRIFDPNIQVPWSESYQVGMQRAFSRNWMAEARFIHTAGHDRWTLGDLNRLNYNEVNMVENGFLQEFRLAQANLVANIAAGQGNTFKYTGVPGTVPLPIFLANLNGSANAKDPKAYAGRDWTSSTLVQSLYALNPNPQIAANALRTNAAYNANMAKAGLPPNFWVANPEVSAAEIATNGPDTRYNGVQLLLNRRFASGYQVQLNYSFGRGYQQDFYSLRKPYVEREQTYTNSSAASGNIRHALQANWLFELPFGQGRRFASGAGGALNRIIGGWSLMGTARLQSGRLLDFGNVRMVGFDEKDLQKMFKLRMVTDPNNQYRTLTFILPQEIIDNTRKAFNVNATGYASGEPTGRYFAPANGPSCLEVAGASTNTRIGSTSAYGDCAARSVVVQGPRVFRVDVTLGKVIPIAGRVRGEYQLQIFNVFNRTNFNPVTWSTSSGNGPTVMDAYRVTGAVDQSRTMQMAFRIYF